MHKPDPAWQGATEVARARLQTIDQALAKLQALVPDVKDVPPSDDQAGSTTESPTTSSPQPNTPNPIETEIRSAASPTPIPASSIQALEAFLTGAN